MTLKNIILKLIKDKHNAQNVGMTDELKTDISNRFSYVLLAICVLYTPLLILEQLYLFAGFGICAITLLLLLIWHHNKTKRNLFFVFSCVSLQLLFINAALFMGNGKVTIVSGLWVISMLVYSFFTLGKRAGIILTLLQFGIISFLIEAENFGYVFNFVKFPIIIPVNILSIAIPIILVYSYILNYIKTNEKLLASFTDINEELAQSEKKFRLITEQSHDLIIIIDPNGFLLYVSPSITPVLDYQIDDIVGTPIYAILHPDEKILMNTSLLRMTTGTDEEKHLQYRLKNRKGEYKWFDAIVQPLSEISGKVTRFQAILRDITEQKNQQILLQKTQKLAKVGGWEYVTDTDEIIWSEQVRNIHEADSSFMPKLGSIMRFYSPEVQPLFINALQQAINNKQSFDVELPLITDRGKHIWTRLMGEPFIEENIVTRVTGVFQNITEQKRNEHNLNLLSELINKAKEAIYVADEAGNLLFVNEEAALLYGYLPEEMLTLSIQDIDLLRDDEQKWNNFLSKLKHKKEILTEYSIKNLENGDSPVEERSQYTTMGGRGFVISFIRNVSERQKAEVRIKKDIELQSVISNISYIFNTNYDFTYKVNEAMRMVGSHIDCSRVFIFEDILGGKAVSNTYEWCGANIQSKKQDLQAIPYSLFSSWRELLLKESLINVSDISKLPSETELIFKPLQMSAILAAPLYADNKFLGFAGVCESFTNREWENSEIELLRTFTNIIANAFEQKNAIDALKKSEKRFREFAEMLPEMVFEASINGKITFINNLAFEKLGINSDDVAKGIYIFNLFADSEREKIWDNFEKHLKGEPFTNQEYIINTSDGKTIPVVVYFNFILRDNLPVGIRAVMVDITILKNAEDEIKLLAQFPEESPNPIIRVDFNGKICYANKQAFLLKKYIEENFETEFKNIFIEVSQNKQYKECEVKLNDNYFTLTLIPLSGLGLYIYGKDISEHKNYESRLIESRIIAERALLTKAQFMSTMSHEIRTPMNAVIGLAHILLKENPKPEQVEYLKTLKFSAENLLALINDILDFSKIEAGKIAFEEIEFSVVELVSSIVNSFILMADEKLLTIKFEIQPNLPAFFVGDPLRLAQVLNNIIGNAIKFTQTGSVVIDIKLISKRNGKAKLLFSVTDTGIGIAPNKINSIFETFTQANTDTSRKYGGTGLGLAICQKLLNLQKSQLKVESTEGVGSRFFFELELKFNVKTNDTETRMEEPIEFESLQGMKVLIVEDNQINQFVAKKFMQNWQISCDIAENGKIAVDMVLKTDYHLILMDLQMPEMNGYEATQAIRSQTADKYKQLPIIALTATVMDEIKTEIEKVGMNAIVSKPFNPNELYSVLCKFYKKQ